MWLGIVERFIDATAEHIRIRAGRGPDPERARGAPDGRGAGLDGRALLLHLARPRGGPSGGRRRRDRPGLDRGALSRRDPGGAAPARDRRRRPARAEVAAPGNRRTPTRRSVLFPRRGMGLGRDRARFTGRRALLAASVVALLVAAPSAFAHIERASYWPDPGAETAGGVPTGGSVPKARGLFKALDKKPPGDTRVVCAGRVPKKPKGLKKGDKGPAQKKLRNKYAKRLRKHPSIKRLSKSIKKATGSKPRSPKKAAQGREERRGRLRRVRATSAAALRAERQGLSEVRLAPVQVQHSPAEALQVQGDPARRQRLRQQRPRRRHVRDLHRADGPLRPHQRSEVRRVRGGQRPPG